MEEKKKVAAAISAVFQYISDEEKSQVLQDNFDTCRACVNSLSLSFWRISGRQAVMQMRNLMQMKAFHYSK